MTKALIAGASVPSGYGLDGGKLNPNLFVTRLATETLGYSFNNIDNISIISADNNRIFLDTALKISSGDYSDVLICWQSLNRMSFQIGLELYFTTACFLANDIPDINLRANELASGKKLTQISDYLKRYYNPHWPILAMIQYINILQELAKQHNTRIFYINFNQPWSKNYFQYKNYKFPADLDDFTRRVLDVEFRDDDTISKLYTMIHNQYKTAGGIHESRWLNLYLPLFECQVDSIAPNDFHPGPQSQLKFFEILAPVLESKIGRTLGA